MTELCCRYAVQAY